MLPRQNPPRLRTNLLSMRRGLLGASQQCMLRVRCHPITLVALEAASRPPADYNGPQTIRTVTCSPHASHLKVHAGIASRSCVAATAVTPGRSVGAQRCCAAPIHQNRLSAAEDDTGTVAKIHRDLHPQLSSVPLTEASSASHPQPQEPQQRAEHMASFKAGGQATAEDTETELVQSLPALEHPKTVRASRRQRTIGAHPESSPEASSSTLQAHSPGRLRVPYFSCEDSMRRSAVTSPYSDGMQDDPPVLNWPLHLVNSFSPVSYAAQRLRSDPSLLDCVELSFLPSSHAYLYLRGFAHV